MYAKTHGATTLGVDGVIIDVEVDVSNGLPCFEMVGMPDAMVREAKERVRTAIKNSGIRMQQDKVTVNLAPAGIRKDSAGLDLPIAVALMAAYGILSAEKLTDFLFVGELSLEGKCRRVNGVLPMAIKAKEMGIMQLVVPRANVNEALLVNDIKVYGVDGLAELVGFLAGKEELLPAVKSEGQADDAEWPDDFSDVQGQFAAKRAFEIAAAGGHNLIMVGSPGAGKTMLARRMSSILPPMDQQEALEVTKIYSIAGLLKNNSGLIKNRPFRSPHHTVSTAAMIGGGSIPRPGEVTLSHNGVLFLDELPEFSKPALESLRQPLEDGQVSVSRVNGTVRFPSRIMLIAALNPCPCGNYGSKSGAICTCSAGEIQRYTRKISGPLLDRIDLHVMVERPKYEELTTATPQEPSAEIRKRVLAARALQLERLKTYKLSCNAHMGHREIKETCHLTQGAQALLAQVFEALGISARSYDRIIKVSRTIADLDASELIEDRHVAEAITYRNNFTRM